jgi:phospholipase C
VTSVLVAALAAGQCQAAATATRPATTLLQQAQSHISHVVIIMQENRSFDSYFGTYPNAHGFSPKACIPIVPGSSSAGCVVPFHDPLDVNAGGPHTQDDAYADLNNGVTTAFMNGFVHQQDKAAKRCPDLPALCAQASIGVARHDVVGYHTADEIPNYWSYAENFVLQDHLFEGARSYSQISHIELASEWSALCADKKKALTCKTEIVLPVPDATTEYPWVTLFQLLDTQKISWKYYVALGNEPDCEDGAMTCLPRAHVKIEPSIWNPAGYFSYVKNQGAGYVATHNPSTAQFFADIKAGTLPQVSWIVPDASTSEHPPAAVTLGMEYVTGLVNTIMASPYWANTAIFITWDDWGGFYDHLPPPNVDNEINAGQPIAGYGLRVPGLMISAYARPGMIDSSVMSFDAYATFIEDLFMNGTRLIPAALGNRDHRPDIRDAIRHVHYFDKREADIGSLLNEFDFTQRARGPMLLPLDIPTSLLADCGATQASRFKCTSPQVTLTWQALTAAQGTPPFTFHVVRDIPQVVVCVTTTTTCTDTPSAGNHVYRAWAVDGNQVASPLSAGSEADEP